MKELFQKYGLTILLLCITIAVKPQHGAGNNLMVELQALQKQLVPDTRVAILHIEVQDTLNPVLKGETDLPQAKAAIVEWFNNKDIAFVDSIRVLPDAVLGDKTWALASLSVSNLRAQPSDASELVSQALMGTPMKVLDVQGNWYRVQTPDFYIGWMDAGGLVLMTSAELDNWKNANRFVFNQITGTIVDAPNKKGQVVSDVVLGNLLVVKGKSRKYFKVALPDGRSGYLLKKQCLSFTHWNHLKPDAQAVISTASQMMGSPYLWGGTSSKGMDCSGLVKVAFYAQGIILARDASQQARYGKDVELAHWNSYLPGDLLFFGRSAQRITHVGIYIGDGDFMHASGRVHISSLNPNDAKFVATRHLVAARRILNLINTPGISRVMLHPWYSVQP